MIRAETIGMSKKQIVLSMAFVSVGCAFLLAGLPMGGVWFSIAVLISIPRQEWDGAVPAREVWKGLGFLAVIAAFVFATTSWMPDSMDETTKRLAKHPAFAALVWVAFAWVLLNRWKKARRTSASPENPSVNPSGSALKKER